MIDRRIWDCVAAFAIIETHATGVVCNSPTATHTSLIEVTHNNSNTPSSLFLAASYLDRTIEHDGYV